MTSSASLPSLRTLPPYQPADMAWPEWSQVPVALVRQVRAWIRSRRQAESSWILWRIGYAVASEAAEWSAYLTVGAPGPPTSNP